MQLWWRRPVRKDAGGVFAPLYGLYEQRLLRQIRTAAAPRHIGLIIDGNRRYGRQFNLNDPADVYMAGADKLDELIDWCIEAGVPAITVWVFSTENHKRAPEEITGIVLYLCSDLASFATGQTFVVDGAQTAH